MITVVLPLNRERVRTVTQQPQVPRRRLRRLFDDDDRDRVERVAPAPEVAEDEGVDPFDRTTRAVERNGLAQAPGTPRLHDLAR
jgi:hypothetical protein